MHNLMRDEQLRDEFRKFREDMEARVQELEKKLQELNSTSSSKKEK